jgi:glycine cleavage system H protein
MNFPDDVRYTREHEWVRVDGDLARIGITDFAQDALGDVVFVQLPQVGATVTAMEACCEVESTKSVSDVYSPVSGTIEEINGELGDAPQRLNEDPYGAGWIFAVRVSDPGQLDGLLDAAGYRQFVESQ